MATNSNYTKLVENYLNGDMSSSEREIFDSQLSSDPLLQSEMSNQSEIIEGIESFRKAELKTRLAAINIEPSILGILSQSAAINTIVTVSTSVVVSVGAYLYFDTPMVENQLQHIDFIEQYQLEESDLPTAQNSIEPIEIKEVEIKSVPVIKETETTEKQSAETSSTQSFDFQVPNSPDASGSENLAIDEEVLDTHGNELEELSKVVTLDKVAVENIIDKKHSFHYRYTNSKLYLYGSFEENPYEIFEINSKNGKRLFFFYQNSYYKIDNNSEITELVLITDANLIKELNILKLKK